MNMLVRRVMFMIGRMGLLMMQVVGMIMTMIVAVLVIMSVTMFMLIRSLLLLPELFPGKFFFSGGNHVDLGRADPAAVHSGNFQLGLNAQRFYGPREQLGRNSGIDQGAKEHIAADSGKAF